MMLNHERGRRGRWADSDKGREWQRRYGQAYYERNREYWLQYGRRWRDEHHEYVVARSRDANRRYKLRVLIHYAGDPPHCALCGFDKLPALTIDHINGKGARHRREAGYNFYIWLFNNGWPDGFRVLCMNCQFLEKDRLRQYGPGPARKVRLHPSELLRKVSRR